MANELKVVKRKKLLAAIRKEYRAGREWSRRDFGNRFKMMIDLDTAQIWSDVITDNSWVVYHDDSIKELDLSMMYFHATVKACEQGYLEEAIEMLEKAGWTIVED